PFQDLLDNLVGRVSLEGENHAALTKVHVKCRHQAHPPSRFSVEASHYTETQQRKHSCKWRPGFAGETPSLRTILPGRHRIVLYSCNEDQLEQWEKDIYQAHEGARFGKCLCGHARGCPEVAVQHIERTQLTQPVTEQAFFSHMARQGHPVFKT